MLLVRIDDRLLHSEVIYGCIPAFALKHLVVSSRESWLELADPRIVPDGVKLSLVDPYMVARLVSPDEVTLVVFGTLSDLALAMESGFEVRQVALANRAWRKGSALLTSTFFADDQEQQVLSTLLDRGVEVVVQRRPGEEAKAVDKGLLASLTPTPVDGKTIH